jgi:hypothetical protein
MTDSFAMEMEIEEHFENCDRTDIDEHDFTDWLAKHDAEVMAKVEERIIALLEEHTGCGYQHDEERRCYCDAIALIKGEKK